MVLVTQNDMGGLGQAIQGLGGALGEVLQQRGQQRSQQQAVQESAQQRAASGSLIQEAIEKASIDPMTGQRRDLSPMELIGALTQAQSQGAYPEDIKSYGTLFSTLSKQEAGDKGKQEKLHKLRVGLSTLGKIEELFDKGNIGTQFGFRVDPFADVGESGIDRGQFRKLGQSLIPLVAAGVSIRNQKEFDEYKSIITNPNASTAQIQGAMRGLKQLMAIQLEEYGEEVPEILSSQEMISTPEGEIVEDQEKVEMKQMPIPSQHKGKIIKSTESGKRYRSDGKRWKEVK